MTFTVSIYVIILCCFTLAHAQAIISVLTRFRFSKPFSISLGFRYTKTNLSQVRLLGLCLSLCSLLILSQVLNISITSHNYGSKGTKRKNFLVKIKKFVSFEIEEPKTFCRSLLLFIIIKSSKQDTYVLWFCMRQQFKL